MDCCTTTLKNPRCSSSALISMDKNLLPDEEFFKKDEAYERESVEDFIKRYSSTEKELKETIAYLIRHGEMVETPRLGNWNPRSNPSRQASRA